MKPEPPTHGLDLATDPSVHEAWLEFFRLCRDIARSARERRAADALGLPETSQEATMAITDEPGMTAVPLMTE